MTDQTYQYTNSEENKDVNHLKKTLMGYSPWGHKGSDMT